ncbi:MAG: LamG domain-containing protein, partial [Nanoarchaeota archaeon]|nr:LamG domain-containing protein [Nanoarchaeota archaeon]MBU1632840.1 LamG domain-containing protein [Nanoarchaeota archaeon]MBU1875903.1 LamG domain-containing protein [Nanoarchaeota archaeon]
RDGVKDSTTYAQTGAIGSGSGSNLIIGAEYDLSTPQDGAIDEVRIYNRSLSQQQILNLYNNYTNRFADEETKVGDILSVQAIPNDGTSDGNMVTSNNVTITDNVIPTVDSLILNTTNPLTNSSVENLTAYPTISDSTGESVKSIYNWILNGNSILLAYFPFERIGGTSTNNARDYISGNNLSEAGGVYWKKAGGYDGKGAYEFDGTNDYLISSGSGLFPNVINSFTMELWVNPTATRANSSESISGTAGISGQRYAIFPANGKNQYTDFHAGAGISVGTNGISVFELSQDYMPSPLVYDATITGWNHVVVVYTNRQPKLYLNGVLVRTGQTSSYTIHPSIDLGEVGAGYGYFKGILDEVRLWNRSLSAEQVLALYNNRTDLIVSNETSVYDNWTAQVTPNDGFVDGATSTSNSIIISSFVVPTQNENDVFGQDEGIGTSLSSVNPASIQTVSNYVWHSLNKGKVQWKVALNLSNANIGNDDDLDNDIEFGDGFVSVNSTSAPAFASKSANITFENMDCNLCNNDGIIYTSGAYTTLADIRTNGQSCSISGRCSAFTCDNPGGIGNCTFDVSSFSGYAYGGNANLTINDSAEGSSVNIDTSINFFAYYVNSTDGAAIPSASCNISFDDAPSIWNQMTWNGTGDNGYNYTKSSGFSSAATHVWNVTCAKSGYTSLTANDTILVTSLYIPPAVPEFENYAILFILVTVIGGFFIMKNKF